MIHTSLDVTHGSVTEQDQKKNFRSRGALSFILAAPLRPEATPEACEDRGFRICDKANMTQLIAAFGFATYFASTYYFHFRFHDVVATIGTRCGLPQSVYC